MVIIGQAIFFDSFFGDNFPPEIVYDVMSGVIVDPASHRDIRTGQVYSHAGHDVTSYFRWEGIAKKTIEKRWPPTTLD